MNVTYKGSCPPDVFPLDGERRKMRHDFGGYAVVFRTSTGLSHCTYLRGCNRLRAISYATSEGTATGACTADVWEVHGIPYHPSIYWREERLPLRDDDVLGEP